VQLPGPTANKLCEISDVSQKNQYFELTLRKDSETCLITYIIPDGTKYNYFITDHDISLEQGSSIDINPSLLKTKKRLNKWKFFGLSFGTYTFVGNGTHIKKTVYPESENIDDITNVEVIAVEENVYSIQLSPSFLYCLHHHKDETSIKNHLSCQDCQMPHVEFSKDFTIFKITKGREYLYPIRCRIPIKKNNLTYFAMLDTTKEHTKDFMKESTKCPEVSSEEPPHNEDASNKGNKSPRKLTKNGENPTEYIMNKEDEYHEEPSVFSMGYTTVTVPWILLCLSWILFGIFVYFLFSCFIITKKKDLVTIKEVFEQRNMDIVTHERNLNLLNKSSLTQE